MQRGRSAKSEAKQGPALRTSETHSMPKPRVEPNSVFLNIPYDRRFQPLYLAYIVGMTELGLTPKATLSIPGGTRRLDRIFELIKTCKYSVHDLSRVELDRTPPPTPRFNMPFELGLVVAWATIASASHRWFVLEEVPHRLTKSLSDLNGTDPFIHNGRAEGVLKALSNALYRNAKSPSLMELETIYRDLRAAASKFRSGRTGDSLFEAHAFKWLVLAAQSSAQQQVAALMPRKHV